MKPLFQKCNRMNDMFLLGVDLAQRAVVEHDRALYRKMPIAIPDLINGAVKGRIALPAGIFWQKRKLKELVGRG